jgi:TonB-dependent starch-binding outer membrane protein SusC
MQFSYAQEKTITGTVTEGGMPLPGVGVIIKGTTTGTETDFNGKYSLKAKQGQELEFSYVGMKKQTIKIGASNSINVVMVEDSEKLSEVVVVGYGTQKRSQVTGSVTTVKASQIENRAFTTFDQALQGQAAGITVLSGSGQPGTAANVRIRGVQSISGNNQPLYILDGTPITGAVFATLNINDFEDFAILKDASATAQYGSRGSNGVIVITSKMGKSSDKGTFTYRSQVGITQVGDAKFEMMNSSQLLNFQRFVGNGLGAGKTDAQIAELSKVNTNWNDVFFRSGITNSHDLSVSGGSENVRYFNSISYFQQDGISKRSDLQRMNFRSNIDAKVSKNTKVGSKILLGFSKQNRLDSENAVALQNPYAAVYLGSPYDALYNADGSYNTGAGKIGANAFENLDNINYRNQVKAVGSLYAEQQIFTNLKARVDFGLDFTNNRFVTSSNPRTFYGSIVTPGNQGSYGETNNYDLNLNSTFRLTYNKTFHEKHDVEVSAYFEYYKEYFNTAGFRGFGINPDLFGYPASITVGTTGNGLIPTVSGGIIERALMSYFAIARYGYDDRFNLDISLRRDASSVFASKKRWGTFWSAGFNWNITNEKFMENNKFFENLKFRASYGEVGNQEPIDPFQEFATWGGASYGGVAGIGQISVPNPELQWETGIKSNIALDFAIFKNSRITGSIEYYSYKSKDLLIDQRTPFESGQPGGLVAANAGVMTNKGFELSLEGFIIKKDNIKFSLYGNFSKNTNLIEDLGQVNEFILGTSIIREGLPFGSHFINGWAGVNPANGAPLYYDLNGNVTNQFLTGNRTANYGSYIPVYSGSFGHRFSYKGFDFSSQFNFMADYFRFNNQTFFSENTNFIQYNQSTAMLGMWKNPGDITDIQHFSFNREFSSKDIEDASFLRLRNIEIGYSLSRKALEQIKFISGFRVYVQGQNLYTWTKFTGFDPEDDNNIAQYEYPTPRVFTFGLDVKF